MTKPTAALVLNYRTAHSTHACLQSLAADRVRYALVVDNSEDGGVSAKELSVLQQSSPTGLELWLDEPQRNLGFAAGVNRGLRLLRERLGACDVILINSDAKVVPGLVQAFRHAAASAVVPPLVEAGERAADGKPRRIVRYCHRALGLFLRHPAPGAFRYLSGCCLFIPAEHAARDLLDEDFFFYGEDIELSWRLMRSGVPLLHSADAWVIHAGSLSSKPNSYFYEYNMARSHILLAKKLARNKIEWLLFLALRVPMLLSRGLVRMIRTRRPTALIACVKAFFAGNGSRRVTP